MSHSAWHDAMNVEDAVDGFEPYVPSKPDTTITRVVRPTFRTGGNKPRTFFSEWQAYLFLARRVVGWIRDHYKDESNLCRLCEDTPRSYEDGERLGCRYHADRSYNRLIQRIATALRRRDRRRAELAEQARKPAAGLTVTRRNAVAAICLSAEAIARNARELRRLAEEEGDDG